MSFFLDSALLLMLVNIVAETTKMDMINEYDKLGHMVTDERSNQAKTALVGIN